MAFKKIWTDEEEQFLISCKGMYYQDVLDKFKSRFSREVTMSSIKHKMQRLCGGNGIDCKYKAGNDSYKLVKNRHNPNKMPELTECSREYKRRKYKLIKVDEKWINKARYVWEQNNGKIPSCGVVVQKVVGDDYSIDNLMLIDKAAMLEYCRRNYQLLDEELRESALLVSKVACDIRKNGG